MKYNKINEMADLVSSGMNDILNSEEHKSIFGGPSFVKEASKKSDEAKAKKEKEDADEAKAKAKKDKGKKDMKKCCPPPKGKKASQLLESIIAVADLLGESNMIRSEAIADKLLQAMVIEARREARLMKKAEPLGLPTHELDVSDISFEDEPETSSTDLFGGSEELTGTGHTVEDAKEALIDLAVDLKSGLKEAMETSDISAFSELVQMEIDSLSSEDSASPLKSFEDVLNIEEIINALTAISSETEPSQIENALDEFESNPDKFMKLEADETEIGLPEESFVDEPIEGEDLDFPMPKKHMNTPESIEPLFE